MPKSLPSVAPFRHNGFGNNSGSARRSLRSRHRITRNTRNSLSAFRGGIPPATSLIPKPLYDMLLNMFKNKIHTAVKFTPEAKNNSIDKSTIYGAVEMNGQNNKITRSVIDVRSFVVEHPIKTIVIGVAIIIFGLIIEYTIFQ